MKLLAQEIEIKEENGFSEEIDIFSRKKFGENLSNLIVNSNENLVLALDSKWGEGKSTFVKMWKGEVGHIRTPPIRTIYFDAFANDYQKDPFLALASEIYEVIEEENPDKKTEFKDKSVKVLKAFSRGIVKTAVKVGSAGMIDGSAIDAAEKELSTLISDQFDSVIASKFENSKADKLAISNFRDFISDIALNQTEGKRIVFIIDELDRCRPDFALDILEKIKHLFSVPGITFLLVMNREQLEESVKSRYGEKIDASTYLQKFIHIWLSLPREKVVQYGGQKDHGELFVHDCAKRMLTGSQIKNDNALDALVVIVKHTKPSFRDIERMLTYFAIIENIVNIRMLDTYQALMALTCYFKVSSPNTMNRIASDEISHLEVNELLNMGTEQQSNNNHLEYLAFIVEFDLANKDRRLNMVEDSSLGIHRSELRNKNILKYFNDILTNIQSTR